MNNAGNMKSELCGNLAQFGLCIPPEKIWVCINIWENILNIVFISLLYDSDSHQAPSCLLAAAPSVAAVTLFQMLLAVISVMLVGKSCLGSLAVYFVISVPSCFVVR